MIVTVQEAAQLWCPQARIVRNETLNTPNASHDVLIGGVNRDALSPARHDRVFPHSCRCIASNCMLWRWHDKGRGYCGLAGQPKVDDNVFETDSMPESDEKRVLRAAMKELEQINRERGSSKHE